MSSELTKFQRRFIESQNDHLNKEQKKELEKILIEMNMEAKKVVEDYVENPPEISGSTVINVHESSPYLDEKKEWKYNKRNVVRKKKK